MLFQLKNFFAALPTLSSTMAGFKESPWIATVYTDISVTWLAFILPYIWCHHYSRDGNPWIRFLIILSPLVIGNVGVAGYLLYTLLSRDSSAKDSLFGSRNYSSRTSDGIRWPIFWFGGLALLYAAVTLYAIITEPLGQGWAAIKKDSIAYSTFIDLLCGIAIFSTLVAVREETLGSWLGWTVAISVVGGGVAALYSLLVMLEAARKNEHFGKVFLTPKGSEFI